jgi:prepilin-type N-terminal cleavage/methylation domain-containing protein
MEADGFTLIEFLITLAIIGIVCGMAFMAFSNALPNIRADSAMQLLEVQLRQAREVSVDQRRDITVQFQTGGHVVTTRQELPSGTTQLSDYVLPYGLDYMLFTGVGDTPDGYGKAYAVTFGCTGLPCTITFHSDGSVSDSLGGSLNGSIFIGKTGQILTARAVTILSATGKIKGYRYTGAVWH